MPANTPKNTNVPAFGKKQIELLERLSNACSVSGDEHEVRQIVLQQIESLADEISVDSLGNVLATRKAGKKPALRVMFAAHMDEVGLMLVDKDEGGFFQFELVGGLDVRKLVAKPVLVGRKKHLGVIGAKPIHLTTDEERKKTVPLEKLRIDMGPAGSDNVKLGDRAVFASKFYRAAGSLCGKALDDRLGVVTLIELMRLAPDHIEFQAAFTVQEEVGLRGAKVAAYKFNPDMAVVIDATPANDVPVLSETPNMQFNTRLDHGPAVYIADSATLSDPRLFKHFTSTAEKYRIPYQIRQPGGGGTDAGAIHKARMGVPSISISIPVRYPHTPLSIVRLKDWQNTFALLLRSIQDLTAAVLERK